MVEFYKAMTREIVNCYKHSFPVHAAPISECKAPQSTKPYYPPP
jgi:hypothetical protein